MNIGDIDAVGIDMIARLRAAENPPLRAAAKARATISPLSGKQSMSVNSATSSA